MLQLIQIHFVTPSGYTAETVRAYLSGISRAAVVASVQDHRGAWMLTCYNWEVHIVVTALLALGFDIVPDQLEE